MENNLENKAKFFAQYWGQRRLFWKSAFKFEVIDISLSKWRNENGWLELKPLSSITDEDKLESIKLGCFINTNLIDFYETEDGLTWSVEIREVRTHTEPVPSSAVDYLRSKGYALPWMGLSVKTMVEYGWIKLKENERI